MAAVLLFDRSETLRSFCPLLVHLAVSILIVTLLVGVGFAMFKPEKLQSEEYQIKQQALMMMEQMGAAPQIIDPQNIVALANPAVQSLAAGSEGK